MDQIRSQTFAGDAARLRRLGELLTFIADLPMSGAVVLTGDRRTRAELYDLILQHRGTAVSAATRIHVCLSADDERRAVAGVSDARLAPGDKALWASGLGAKPTPGRPGVIHNARVSAQAVASAVAALSGHRSYHHRIDGAEPPPARAEVPGALRHAWPSAVEAPATGKPPAWIEGQPVTAATHPTPGPWQKPKAEDRRHSEVVIRSYFKAHYGERPFRLYADLPPECGGGYVQLYASQAEADAGLPAFVQYIRGILERHDARDQTAPLAA